MLEPVAAAGDRRTPEPLDDLPHRRGDLADGGVTDDMEPRRDTCLGTGMQMRDDLVAVEVAIAARVVRIGVGLVQPCRA